MAIYLTVTKIFSGQFYSLLNMGIVLLSIVESYIFPFAIVKWIVVVSKYSGLVNLHRASKVETKTVCRYKYKLQLLTVCRNSLVDVNKISHVNVVVDCDGIQVYHTILLLFLFTIMYYKCETMCGCEYLFPRISITTKLILMKSGKKMAYMP